MIILMLCCMVLIVLAGARLHKKNIEDFVQKHRWYLAGPMSAVSTSEAIEWRKEAGRHLAVIDPVEVEQDYGRLVTGNGNGLKDHFKSLRVSGDLQKLHTEMQPILILDEESVSESFGLLVRIPNKEKFMWGTVREVVLARQQGKPVVIWCEARGLLINNTMVSFATAIRASFDSAIAACRKLQIGQKIPLTLPEEKDILSGKDVSAWGGSLCLGYTGQKPKGSLD